MSPAERARIVDMLPTSLPIELAPPEGDAHRKAKQGALTALDDFFRRAGRKIYLSSELVVFYPGERSFVPDLFAVLDVDPHDRTRWVKEDEGKGLDLVVEVHVAGQRSKDMELNVERYARLGIHEYFMFDRARRSLHGYRLPAVSDAGQPPSRVYQRIVPQAGHFASVVLGLDLVLDGDRLRFFSGNAPLEDADEMIARLGAMLDKVIAHAEEVERHADEERLRADEEKRHAEEERLRADEEKRHAEELAAKLEEVERQLAEARAEIARLKR